MTDSRATPSASGEGSMSAAMRKGNVSALDILDVKVDTDSMDLDECALRSSTSLSGKITPTQPTGINGVDATIASGKTPGIQPQRDCPDSTADTSQGLSVSSQVPEQPQVDRMDRSMTEAEVVFYTSLLLLYNDIKRWLPSLTISDAKTPSSQMEQASDSDELADNSVRPEVQEESFDVLLRGLLSDLRRSALVGEYVDCDIAAEDGCNSTDQITFSEAEWIIAKKLEEFFLPILRKYKGSPTGPSGLPREDETVYDYFASELAEMKEMGFSDVTSNMIALMEKAFDVEEATLWILKIHNPHVIF